MSYLYELSSEYQRLLAKDEYTFEELDALDQFHDDIQNKAVNVAAHIRNLTNELVAVLDAEKSIHTRAKKLENKIDSLKEYLGYHLINCKIKEITQSPYFVIKLKNNAAHVHVKDKALIPQDYFKRHETFTIDKELIKFDINRGIDVPGCELKKKINVEIK